MTRRTAENAPAHTIVEVVDKPGLRCRNEIAITERGGRKDIPKADWGGLVRAVADFQAYVVSRVPDEKHHPLPTWRPYDHKGNRHTEQPSQNKHALGLSVVRVIGTRSGLK
jgi:hypothetical protein